MFDINLSIDVEALLLKAYKKVRTIFNKDESAIREGLVVGCMPSISKDVFIMTNDFAVRIPNTKGMGRFIVNIDEVVHAEITNLDNDLAVKLAKFSNVFRNGKGSLSELGFELDELKNVINVIGSISYGYEPDQKRIESKIKRVKKNIKGTCELLAVPGLHIFLGEAKSGKDLLTNAISNALNTDIVTIGESEPNSLPLITSLVAKVFMTTILKDFSILNGAKALQSLSAEFLAKGGVNRGALDDLEQLSLASAKECSTVLCTLNPMGEDISRLANITLPAYVSAVHKMDGISRMSNGMIKVQTESVFRLFYSREWISIKWLLEEKKNKISLHSIVVVADKAGSSSLLERDILNLSL